MSAAHNEPAHPGNAARLIELYYEQGWTDGLPVVPPSEESVGAMLAAAGLRGNDLIGEVFERHARLTADKVAVNAVLAGCRPAYMPVVVAAMRGLLHKDYHYHGAATSTGGSSVAVIVNGPIARELEINSGTNALGPGTRANATIGRAVRLTMMNALNTRAPKLDRSTLGNAGKYSLCFAENEAASPWEPLHVERGFKAGESTVTVFAAEGHIQIYNQLSADAETLCRTMADAMSQLGSMGIVGQPQTVVIFAGEHQEVFRKAGWSRARVRQCLYDHARRTIADAKRAGRLPGRLEPKDESTWRHAVARPEDILMVAAGGDAGAFSACLPGWGSGTLCRAVTTRIERP
ncbi:MAG: hypothetical protein HY342_07080 [Candidatus Lambdaproteobacteria bacterium]|nr:hypothetical protein [Candidatus Lambdaproteobacteria bacterium]